jgi:hypothetical protein
MSADEEPSPKHVDHGSPSFLEKLGAGTDALLEDFFRWWGTGELEGIWSATKYKLLECVHFIYFST